MRSIGGVCVARAVVAIASVGVAGCISGNQLVFGTATKFALDVSQRSDKNVEVTMGYQRVELASIPTACTAENQKGHCKETGDASQTTDAYSVIGAFSVTYGNPLRPEPLEIRQAFATGMAARAAAHDPEMKHVFPAAAQDLVNKTEPDAAGLAAPTRRTEKGNGQ